MRTLTRCASVVDEFAEALTEIDFDTVRRDLDRALRSAVDDPEDAITAACSVVESVCRSILIELGLPLPARKDVQGLYQAVREPLGLSPDKSGVPNDISADVRAILGGITRRSAVSARLGPTRATHTGESGDIAVWHARIARLSIHAAASVALFLVETWQTKFPKRPLASR